MKKSNKNYIPLVITLIIIGVVLYVAGSKEPVVIETPIVTEEDSRIAEYLKSQEAKLQAQLHIYEEDRVTALAINKENLAKIEADYKALLQSETERHANEMLKVNTNLDNVRKQILTKPSLE